MASGIGARVGDWVEVRPLAEIMATLDENGALEATPFMPEMAQYAGRRFQIVKSAHKTCDPTGASELRRMADAVHLATRCDGTAHDGCEARCLLFWKRAWLKPADGPGADVASPAPTDDVDLSRLHVATRRTTESGELRYRCQVTEIVAATTPLPISNLRQYVEDVASGNAPPVEFARELAHAYAKAVVRKALRLIGLGDSRSTARRPGVATTAARNAAKLDLEVGEWVKIRPAEEILATLDDNRKNRGLVFEQEMLRHCGKTYRVLARLSRIIDEKSGKMIALANDCIALEGLTCRGLDNRQRLFCPRGPFFYWREAWLERANAPTGVNAPLPRRSANAATFAVEVSFDESEARSQWEELEKRGTPFQTRAWILPWLQIVAPKFGATPVYVTVRDRHTQRAVMFFPLCRRRWRGLATIEFPDLGLSDYNAPLTAPDLDLDAAEIRDLWDQIHRGLPPADIVRFDKVPTTFRGRDNPIARLEWMQRTELCAWELRLPPKRELYDERALDRKTRKEHRRKRKHLAERVGAFELRHAATPSDGEAIFDALRNQRRVRFQRTRRSDVLDNPCFLAFYRALILDKWRPFVDLSALKAGDTILSALFALRHDGAYLLLMHSFEPTLEALSPGIVAIDEMVTHLIESGDRCFDFTVGNEAYKREFGARATPLASGLSIR
ncbi:MAG: GNAT family N-acetyltransferase [Roseiarcus sp.]